MKEREILVAGPKVFSYNIDRLTDRANEAMQAHEHLWVYTGQKEGVNLDLENLLTIDGPGCFICEEIFSPQLAALPCPGNP